MQYLSLFSGIGGFELGIGEKGNCIGFSEIDKYATQIYKKHFPNHKEYGDITKLNPEELPDFDFLCGGFPCQSFSVAGKRGGFDDTRGTLFFEIARILKNKKPRLLLLENVKGLLSHDKGDTFKVILTTLDELGYDVQWQVLNSKDFGVPQNRERLFIVGHLRGTGVPKVFPIIGENREDSRTVGHGLSNTLTRRSAGNDNWRGNIVKVAQSQRVLGIDGVSATLCALGGGDGAKTGLYKIGDQIRKLTPLECERLQGFPDYWTEGLSDNQRYKCCGNAVTTNVVKAIVDKLFVS